MRTAAVVGCCVALAVGACNSSKKAGSTEPSTTTGSSTTTVTPPSSSTRATSTSAAPTTTVARPTTTTTRPCAPIPTPSTPVKGPATTHASLLTNVAEIGDSCVDDVVFDFTAKSTDRPGYTIAYGTPPFFADASGAVVPVAGNAFITVRVFPGYGYDYETGRPTYTGPKSIAVARANHVRAIVETGDNEGVLNWVIGLDTKRPFRVQAAGTPRHQLVVTVG